MVKLVECPRDAMQGLTSFIPTSDKITYLNSLLSIGFDTLDFGSFVSPKAIPQMRDTTEVVRGLDLTDTKTKLLAIVANKRGAVDALAFEEIDYLGFPFSISETFQQRNTNLSIMEALNVMNDILELCHRQNKEMVAYISMGFGNPYNDPYSPEVVEKFTGILVAMGIKIISLSDTVGMADDELIQSVFATVTKSYPEMEFGAHFHARPEVAGSRIVAAYDAGCRRFDSALRGLGGCPMAKDELVGNIPTEALIRVLAEKRESLGIDNNALANSLKLSAQILG
jgi:hydroxymethylglutaryl-CoA lyase